MSRKIAIVGGGIVGLATAYRLIERFPAAHLLLLEKESGPGRHQTGHNSGVLHCGLYYKPGSLRARLAVEGIRKMVAFCAAHSIPHDVCGKIVVASTPEQLPRLHALHQRGIANGLESLRILGPEQIREVEPHAAGLAALHVPQEGIADYPAVAQTLAREIQSRGGEIRFSTKVTGFRQRGNWTIETTQGDFEAAFLINCAGLQCDRISRMAGAANPTRIVPFRGEYFRLRADRQFLVRNLIYPVPDPEFPFLGVHFTRLIHGGIQAGPNAQLALAREAYRKIDFSFRDAIENIAYPGFWRFFLRYPSMCWDELKQSLSKELFCRALQRLVPEVQTADLTQGEAGIRAQALAPSGELLQDFEFARQPNALHVLNAPSPAATASLAIADEIIDRAQDAIEAAIATL
jgi:L-2-hydroxyglutarate oxidase LhgO